MPRYVDMSNLNAREDAWWLAGVGASETPVPLSRRALPPRPALFQPFMGVGSDTPVPLRSRTLPADPRALVPFTGVGQYQRRPPLSTLARGHLMAPITGMGLSTARGRAMGRGQPVGQIVPTLRQRTAPRLMRPVLGLGGGVLGGGSSLGTLDAYEQEVMDLPVLEGLGWTSRDCWSPPGGSNPDDSAFKICHDKQLVAAQSNCYTLQATPDGFEKRGYADFDDCVRKTRDVLIDSNCLQYCMATAANYRGGDPCNSTRAIMYAQKKLGVSVDGNWGSGSQAALLASGYTYKGLIGCTGACPTKVGGLCDGDCQTGYEIDPATGLCVKVTTDCPAGTVLVNGNCIVPPPPVQCGVDEDLVSGACVKKKCPTGFQLVNGECKTLAPKKAGMGATGWMLAGLGLAGLAGLAFAATRKKKPARRRRR